MNSITTVGHCLAVWNVHSGEISQTDKDFFDERVATALKATKDEFLATFELIAEKMHAEDAIHEEAIAHSYHLVSAYAKAWGRELGPLAEVREPAHLD